MPGALRILIVACGFSLLCSGLALAQTTEEPDRELSSLKSKLMQFFQEDGQRLRSYRIKFVPPSPEFSIPALPPVIPDAEEAKAPPENPVKPMEEIAPPPLPSDLDSANHWFEQNNYSLATKMFQSILENQPSIKNAAEIKYKLALSFYFQNNIEKAQETLSLLVNQHYTSPWAKIVLVSHFDEKNFAKFLNEVYPKARDQKAAMEAQKVMDLIPLYVNRFSPNDQKKHELIYKAAVCLLVLGKTKESENTLAGLKEKAADSGWATLADFRLGGQEIFEKKMEDLINLTHVQEEQLPLFEELASEYYPRLQGENKAKCRFFQTRCLEEKDHPKCLGMLKEIVQQHPMSPWAGEAAFWLAEYSYRDGKHEAAKSAFLDFAQKYPNSPRAALARKWAGWIDQRKQFQAEMEKLLITTLLRFQKESTGYAADLKLHLNDRNQTLNAQFAVQQKRLLLNLSFKDKAMCLVSNQQGTWFLSHDQKTLYRTKDKQMPIPQFCAELDPVEKKFAFNFKATEENSAPLVLKVPPSFVSTVVTKFLTAFHGRVETVERPNGKSVQIFHVEGAHKEADYFPCFEVETEDGFLREIRVKVFQNGKELAWLELKGIRLGEHLEESTFNFPALPPVAIREMDVINFWEVYGHVMQFATNLFQEIDWKKNISR